MFNKIEYIKFNPQIEKDILKKEINFYVKLILISILICSLYSVYGVVVDDCSVMPVDNAVVEFTNETDFSSVNCFDLSNTNNVTYDGGGYHLELNIHFTSSNVENITFQNMNINQVKFQMDVRDNSKIYIINSSIRKQKTELISITAQPQNNINSIELTIINSRIQSNNLMFKITRQCFSSIYPISTITNKLIFKNSDLIFKNSVNENCDGTPKYIKIKASSDSSIINTNLIMNGNHDGNAGCTVTNSYYSGASYTDNNADGLSDLNHNFGLFCNGVNTFQKTRNARQSTQEYFPNEIFTSLLETDPVEDNVYIPTKNPTLDNSNYWDFEDVDGSRIDYSQVLGGETININSPDVYRMGSNNQIFSDGTTTLLINPDSSFSQDSVFTFQSNLMVEDLIINVSNSEEIFTLFRNDPITDNPIGLHLVTNDFNFFDVPNMIMAEAGSGAHIELNNFTAVDILGLFSMDDDDESAHIFDNIFNTINKVIISYDGREKQQATIMAHNELIDSDAYSITSDGTSDNLHLNGDYKALVSGSYYYYNIGNYDDAFTCTGVQDGICGTSNFLDAKPLESYPYDFTRYFSARGDSTTETTPVLRVSGQTTTIETGNLNVTIPETFNALNYDLNLILSNDDIPAGYECTITITPDSSVSNSEAELTNHFCDTSAQRRVFSFGNGGYKNFTITLDHPTESSLQASREVLVNLPVEFVFYDEDGLRLNNFAIDGVSYSSVYSTNQNTLGYGEQSFNFSKGTTTKEFNIDVTRLYFGTITLSIDDDVSFLHFEIRDTQTLGLIPQRPFTLSVSDPESTNTYSFTSNRYSIVNIYGETTPINVILTGGNLSEELTAQIIPDQDNTIIIYVDFIDEILAQFRTFTIRDDALNLIEGARVTLEEYSPSSDSFVNVSNKVSDSYGRVSFSIIPRTKLYNICSYWAVREDIFCLNGIVFVDVSIDPSFLTHTLAVNSLEVKPDTINYNYSTTRLNSTLYRSILTVVDTSNNISMFCQEITDVPLDMERINYTIGGVTGYTMTTCINQTFGSIDNNIIVPVNYSDRHRFIVENYYILDGQRIKLEDDDIFEDRIIREASEQTMTKTGISLLFLLVVFGGSGYLLQGSRDMTLVSIFFLVILSIIFSVQIYFFIHLVSMLGIITCIFYCLTYYYCVGGEET